MLLAIARVSITHPAVGHYGLLDCPSVLDSNKKVAIKPRGWMSACPPSTKPLRRPQPNKLWSRRKAKTFIVEHDKAIDLCINTVNIYLNGFLQSHSDPIPQPVDHIVPSFATCTTSLHGDILAVPTKDWAEDVLEDPAWERKPHSKIYWRGRSTGGWYGNNNWWNLTQRVRFVKEMNVADEEVFVLPSTENKYEPVGPGDRTEQGLLNHEWVDIRFVDKPVQCDGGAGGACETLQQSFSFVPPEPSDYEKQWKFLADVSFSIARVGLALMLYSGRWKWLLVQIQATNDDARFGFESHHTPGMVSILPSPRTRTL